MFLGLFAACLAGQSLAGRLAYNNEQSEHGEPGISYSGYFGNPHFWQAVGENLLSIFLRQKGSPESKPVAAAHYETGR